MSKLFLEWHHILRKNTKGSKLQLEKEGEKDREGERKKEGEIQRERERTTESPPGSV